MGLGVILPVSGMILADLVVTAVLSYMSFCLNCFDDGHGQVIQADKARVREFWRKIIHIFFIQVFLGLPWVSTLQKLNCLIS